MKERLTLVFFCFGLLGVLAQATKETNLIADGNELQQDEAYIKAEAEYRKALSINNINTKAQHNLGNALYRTKDFDQANQRFFETQKNSQSKEEKHLAFHNMGNGFMQQKIYEKAVEAYKNALRNNPTDEETRYNYALAKELLEKQKQEEEQQDKNQDQQEQQNQQDDQDQKEDDSEGDKKENPSDDGEEGDNKEDKKDKEEKDEKGDKDKKKDEPKKPEEEKKEGDQKKSPPPRKPGQISPEQVKSLLEAMNQQEKNVQDKINAKKVQGVPVKTKKDW